MLGGGGLDVVGRRQRTDLDAVDAVDVPVCRGHGRPGSRQLRVWTGVPESARETGGGRHG